MNQYKRKRASLGKRFGRLIIIEQLPYKIYKDNTKHKYWKCQCDCGNITEVYSGHLTSGRIVSCGCYHLEKVTGQNSSKYAGYADIPGNFWSRLKLNAKKRNIEFNLNLADAYNILIQQKFRCALSGITLIIPNPVHRHKNTFKEGNLSLYRIDSSKGYTIDNIQWVDKYVNLAKRNLSDQEYIQICQKVVNYQKEIGRL